MSHDQFESALWPVVPAYLEPLGNWTSEALRADPRERPYLERTRRVSMFRLDVPPSRDQILEVKWRPQGGRPCGGKRLVCAVLVLCWV